jgi:hypothetical protein
MERSQRAHVGHRNQIRAELARLDKTTVSALITALTSTERWRCEYPGSRQVLTSSILMERAAPLDRVLKPSTRFSRRFPPSRSRRMIAHEPTNTFIRPRTCRAEYSGWRAAPFASTRDR